MAYELNKLARLADLKALAQKVVAENYAKQSAVEALAGKVDELVTAGGEPNKLEGVKVNGTALEIADKMVDILIATGTTNGTISVNNAEVAIAGLQALAFKAEVSEAELAQALKDVIAAKAEQSALDEVSGKVTTLVGEDANKSVRTIANEELAAQLIGENAKESLDTLEEIAAWIQAHPDDASAMNKAISDLTALVGTLPEGATSTTVVGYIAEAIAAIGIGDYAKTTWVTEELAKKVDKVEGQRLMTDAEGAKLAGIAEGATKVEASETNGNVKVNGQEVVVYTEPEDVVHDADIADVVRTADIANMVEDADIEDVVRDADITDVLRDEDVATDAEVAEMLAEVFPAQA